MKLFRLLGTLGQYCIKLVKVLLRLLVFPVLIQALHSISPAFVALFFCLPMDAGGYTESAQKGGGKMGLRRNLPADLYLIVECAVVTEEIQAYCENPPCRR